jgi:hypothetical protein
MTAEVAQASTEHLNMTIGCLPDQRAASTALVIATTALSLLAGGCASLVNTPAQDVAWSRWRICHTPASGTEIRNVQLDGRITFWYYGPGDRQVMLDCLRQAAGAGVALPEPIADSLPRGT